MAGRRRQGNGGVVVLNASWEPLSMTNMARAVMMIRTGAAVIHEAVEGKVLRTAGGEEMPLPRVIRRVKYVAVKTLHSIARWSRKGVRMRDRDTCAYCGGRGTTVDHLLPRSRGGRSDDWLNTVACCTRCNGIKGNRTAQEAGMKLLWEPWAPRVVEILARHANIDDVIVTA